MKQKHFIILLIIVVSASGCISQNTDSSPENMNNTSSEKTTETVEMVKCGDVDINIFQADGETAIIRQINENPVGKVRVTWLYSDGNQVSKNVNLTVRGRMVTVQSSSSGSLDTLRVGPVRCPEISFEE